MHRVQVILLALFATMVGQEARAAESDSIAIVFSRNIEGTSCGNGFFIGDGTLFVTARHVIFPDRASGQHQGEAMVTVLSQYLGDASEMRVVAQDPQLDVVLLRGRWKGHPALALAAEGDVAAAERLRIAGFPAAQSAVTDGRSKDIASPIELERVTLDVNAVIVRHGATQTIETNAALRESGWAGAPMFIPGAGTVAGCFSTTAAKGTKGVGVSSAAILRLIKLAEGAAAAMEPASKPLPSDSSSAPATSNYLRAIAASSAGDASAAAQNFQLFLKIRPTSAVGCRDAAGQLRALNRLDESQELYARALTIDPSLISARVLYGQLLHERLLLKAAEEHLRYAWEQGGGSTAAVIPLCNLLHQQNREAECLTILNAAVQRAPRDSHLWNYLGQSKRTSGHHAGAAVAFVMAADLMPENQQVRVWAAQEFDALDQRAAAEEQYQKLIAEHADSSAAHYFFARFLASDKSRKDEALQQAAKALELSHRATDPPRAAIQSLVDAIRSGRRSPADNFRL